MNSESASDSPAPADQLLSSLLERCTFDAPGTPVTCAFSGGADSTALLALAVAAGLSVTAVHVDHGLRSGSADDAEAAAQIAAGLGVGFRCVRIRLGDGPNLEARARRHRRRAVGDDALTGHTADDQAETVLLSALRGAGAAGLGAMRPGRTKPLLDLRRAETRALCAALCIDVVTDPSNTDPRFRRNRVRHELLDLLDDIAERDVVPLLNRTADLLRADDALLQQLADGLDPTDARALTDAPRPLAARAVRTWITATVAEATGDDRRHPPDLDTIERVLAVADGSSSGCDVSGGWRVERSQQRLRLFSTRPPTR